MARRLRVLGIAAAAFVVLAALYSVTPRPAPAGALQGFLASPTSPQFLKLRTDLATTMHNAVTSLPVPSGGSAGGSLSTWLGGLGNGFYTDGVVLITASGTTTLTGPVGLYGGLTSTGQEYLLGKLNGGSDISLTATAGYAEKVVFVGAFDFLALGGVGVTITPSGGQNVTVKAAPLQL